MTRAVVDASVVVMTIVDRPQTANARAVIRSRDLAAPSLIAAEIANTLLKYVRAGSLSAKDAKLALDTVSRQAIDLYPINDVATNDAFSIGLALSHPVYDCYYLSLSRSLNAPFITADKKLLQKASMAQFDVISLDDIADTGQ